MNAGNLAISIEADMKALDAQFAALEAKFMEAGKRAASAFTTASATPDTAGQSATVDAAKQMVDDFKKASAEAVADFKKAGEQAGEAFRKEVEQEMEKIPKAVTTALPPQIVTTVGEEAGAKTGNRFADQFGKQGASMMRRFAAPLMAAQLANTLAGIIRSEKPLNEAILDGIKTIPFIGAFANLGHAIYEATFGAADRAAEDLVKKQEAAKAEILRGVTEREQGTQQSQARQFELRMQQEQLGFQVALNEVRKTGDEEAIARAEFQKTVDEQDLETQLAMAKELTDEEFNAFLRVQNLKRTLAKQELEMRLDTIEKQRKAEEDALKEKQEAEAKALKTKTESEREAEFKSGVAEKKRLINEIRKFEADQEKEIERLEKERISAIEQADEEARSSTRVGSVDTAIGEFKFSAYPDSERKRMDQMAVDTLRGILSKIDEQIKTQREAVFT
jgi:hypothetical protein